ncbi:MAG TPA: hypothetical protein VJU79_10170 [Candidatus Dormibacteraeota bacterium]|nr:hypothetical protein [Candidatus Dormibacteraeota bacterium]
MHTGYTRPRMLVSPAPNLDLVLGLPMLLLLASAGLAFGAFVLWGRSQRR